VLFNSFQYILLFLPVVVITLIAVRRLAGARAAQLFVLLVSVVFYGWFRSSFLWYLGGSIVANWFLARRIASAEGPSRKRWLQLGLVANVGFLSTFKYINFLARTLPFAHGREHLIPDLESPLGLSFFTLTQVMYLVDCYESVLPASTLFDHATFVSFFPYVISGPLARAKRMIHQFGNFGGTDGRPTESVSRGLFLFSMGLFKKAVFAQTFSQIADFGFNSVQHRSALEAAVFSGAYMFQIYFDFSGYSDMAIGTAEMLGITIPPNFDAPLRSVSLIEFWQRWHISLSGFITTYLYTPMLRGLGRVSLAKSMLATLLAMAIAGLWHGPSWTFVVFGLLHGAGLALNSLWRRKSGVRLPRALSWLLTILYVDVAFVFFRSATLWDALRLLCDLVSWHHPLGAANLVQMRANFSWPIFGPPLLFGLLAAFIGKSSEARAREFRPHWKTALLCGLGFAISALFLNSEITASFIYFKF